MEDRRANVAAAADGRATLDAPKHAAALLSGAADWAAAQTKSPSMAWGLGSDDGRGSVSYFSELMSAFRRSTEVEHLNATTGFLYSIPEFYVWARAPGRREKKPLTIPYFCRG
jgi:hypothetical protein